MSDAALESVQDPKVLNLSLVSHTNVGKTTLARTLVRSDVGDVLDQAHVTEESEAYTLIETDSGERLELWDTPGFGDSARLLKRLERENSGLGWFLTQVWDRFSNRAMWCSQQAIRNVREQADVVLYLVNASEYPEDAGYVEIEMEILGWIAKPVLVLINQTGPGRPAEERNVDLARWQEYMGRFDFVKSVLELDAFSRSWVQEGVLFERVRDALPRERSKLLETLLGEWNRRSEQVFQSSMSALAVHLARTAGDRELLEGTGTDWLNAARRNGMKNLVLRLEESLSKAVDRLIELHGLEGEAIVEVKAKIEDYTLPADQKAPWLQGLLGGVAGGAITGFTADLVSGGLTLGSGMIAGAVLGFFGTAGAAKGLEVLRGRDDQKYAAFRPEFLYGLCLDACLRYLAVAHFGRGTGRFRERRKPEAWRTALEEALEPRSKELRAAFESASTGEQGATDSIERVLTEVCRRVLESEL